MTAAKPFDGARAAKLEALLVKATPGPLAVWEGDYVKVKPHAVRLRFGERPGVSTSVAWFDGENARANAMLFVSLRNELPDLLAALRSELARADAAEDRADRADAAKALAYEDCAGALVEHNAMIAEVEAKHDTATTALKALLKAAEAVEGRHGGTGPAWASLRDAIRAASEAVDGSETSCAETIPPQAQDEGESEVA